MSRETKIGMVVAVSFLCLVGVVVATKWRRADDGAKEIAKNELPKEPVPVNPNEPTGSNPPAKNGLQNTGFVEKSPSKPPTDNDNPPLPVVVPMSDPATPMFPTVPSLPTVNSTGSPSLPMEDAARNALLAQIEKDKQNQVTLPPPPLPLPSNIANGQNDQPKNPLANGNENANGFGPAKNQALPPVNNNGPFTRGNDEGFKPLPKVEDVAAQPIEGAQKTAQGASDKFDALLNKGNDATNKGIDNVNKGIDNANKNLTVPPPVPANPMVPPLPTFPAADNNNNNNSNNPLAKIDGPPPAIPAPTNQSLPPITNSNNNPLAKVEAPQPAIPAPTNQNLPPITNNNPNNSGFVIPQPGTSSEVKVTNAQSYVARAGDSFASLSKAVYGVETYGNALLAFNRDYNREYNRSSTTLQPGQKVMLPSRQLLQDQYAAALADNRSGVIASGGISINPPIPVMPKSNQPVPPTSDVTKSYRVPAAGQPIYELAIQTLGDGARWTEIYRLNPNLDPLQPIPGGTVVRLPVNARVP